MTQPIPSPRPERRDGQPDLSVVLVTPGGPRAIDKVLRSLHAQTIRGRTEVLVCAVGSEAVDLSAVDAEDFWGVRVLQADGAATTAQARALAIHAARAPVVALAEDHCFPEPEWAERIVEAHAEDVAVVGPVIVNANPATALSWANLLFEYAPWMHAAAPHEPEHLPGHNSAYKRAALLAYGEGLGAMLEAETLLHWDLRDRGQRLLHHPGIRTRHVNFSLWPSSIKLRYLCGQAFAGQRAQPWPAWRRAAYAALALPVRARQMLRALRAPWADPELRREVLRAAPALLFLLGVESLGQAAGYAFGEGRAWERLARIELRRAAFVRPPEREILFC